MRSDHSVDECMERLDFGSFSTKGKNLDITLSLIDSLFHWEEHEISIQAVAFNLVTA